MNFLSPAELARHLRELVDDEDFIIRTVRVHFPEYKREVRQVERQQEREAITRQRAVTVVESQPAPQTPLVDPVEKMARRSMELGSQTLLHALWRDHAPKLRELEEYGNALRSMRLPGPQVVRL